MSLFIRACARRRFHLPSLGFELFISLNPACARIGYRAGSSLSCVNARARACACCDPTLWFLRLSSRSLTSSKLTLSLSLSPASFSTSHLLPVPPCFVSSVCGHARPFSGCVFNPVRWSSRGGPNWGIMDGGAWIPLRIRYLPRWHHTGSYQLYPGEERAGALNTRFPTEGNANRSQRSRHFDSRSFSCGISDLFVLFRLAKEV